jgi:hypothetical protein
MGFDEIDSWGFEMGMGEPSPVPTFPSLPLIESTGLTPILGFTPLEFNSSVICFTTPCFTTPVPLPLPDGCADAGFAFDDDFFPVR